MEELSWKTDECDLSGRRFLNDEEEMAAHEWLTMEEPDLYRDEHFKFVPRWHK
jgi:hypothetical protein